MSCSPLARSLSVQPSSLHPQGSASLILIGSWLFSCAAIRSVSISIRKEDKFNWKGFRVMVMVKVRGGGVIARLGFTVFLFILIFRMTYLIFFLP